MADIFKENIIFAHYSIHMTWCCTDFVVQNQDLAAEAQKTAALQDELDVAKGFEEKAVSVYV